MRNAMRLRHAAALLLTLLAMSGCGEPGRTNIDGALLESIAVTAPSSSLPTEACQQYSAIGTYSDYTTEDLTRSVVWTSSDAGKADVSATGLVTALAEGTATIRAALGSVEGRAALSIATQTATLTGIEITPAVSTITVNTQQQFAAIGAYSDGTTQNVTGAVAWVSSNEENAIVSAGGLATGIAEGVTIITAASRNVSGATMLTVQRPPELTLTASIPSPAKITSVLFVAFTANINIPGDYEYLFMFKNPPGAGASGWSYPNGTTYSSANTWTLSAAGRPAGVYTVQAYCRKSGSTAQYDYIATISFELTPSDPPEGTTVTPSVASPQPAGTHIRLFPGTTNNAVVCTYQIKVASPDGTEKVISPSSGMWIWDTYGLTPGDYRITAGVKTTCSSTAYDQPTTIPFTINPMTTSALPDFDPTVSGKVLHDGSSNTYYVAGSGFVARYDADWNLIWNTTGLHTAARAGFDRDGNIIVAGNYTAADNVAYAYVQKIDPGGHPLWTWTAPERGIKVVFGFDSDNNIYAAFASAASSSMHMATGYIIKLDAAGNQVWSWQAQPSWVVPPTGCVGATVYFMGLAVDADGNIRVSGTAGNNASFEGVTRGFFLTFDASGNELSNIPVAYGGMELFQDGQGNYITLGSEPVSSGANINAAADITKFKADGTVVWQNRIIEAGGPNLVFRDVVQDQQGNTYILTELPLDDTTATVTNEYSGIYITKIDSNGNKQLVIVGGATPEEPMTAQFLSLDGFGNSYAAVTIALPSGSYTALIKFDPDGHQVWIK